MRGLDGYLSDLTVASSPYNILLYSETLLSDMRNVSELLVPEFGRPVLLSRGKMPRTRGMAAYVQDGDGAFCQLKFECGCCEMLICRVCAFCEAEVSCVVLCCCVLCVNFHVFRSPCFHHPQTGWPVCGWFEWPSPGVIGFYVHESSWCSSPWLRNSVGLRLVGSRPNPCTWCNTWPPNG